MEKFETTVVIIGAGLFGSMTAKYLRSKGIESIIVDRHDPLAASKCSSGIWRPGWAEKVKLQVERSLPVISQFVAIDTLPIYDLDRDQDTKIDYIDCNGILDEDFLDGEVVNWVGNPKQTKCASPLQGLVVEVEGGEIQIDCEYVVVCAGAFTNQVLGRLGLPVLFDIDKQWGMVQHYKPSLAHNFIKTWAPYKQMYGLNLEREGEPVTYFTNGSSVKNTIDGDARVNKLSERVFDQTLEIGLEKRNLIKDLYGFRPYLVQKDTDFVNRHASNVISATGGAKNSTLLSGYVAQRIFQEISGKHN